MNKEFWNIANIERYEEDRMSCAERTEFEQRLRSDEQLAEELELYRIVVKGLKKPKDNDQDNNETHQDMAAESGKDYQHGSSNEKTERDLEELKEQMREMDSFLDGNDKRKSTSKKSR